MADLTDVLHGIRDAITAALYPDGPPGKVKMNSVAGGPVRVFVGWPDASLDKDVADGITLVSVWPRPGMATNLGPYLQGWVSLPQPTPSLTRTIAGNQITFGGTGAVPLQIVAVVIDQEAAFTYPLVTGDGPSQVAAGLAAAISAVRPATAAGAVLTIPDANEIACRVVAGGLERRETRRVSQSIQITAWAPTGVLRDAVIRAIDDAFDDEHRGVTMPDGTTATVSYQGTTYNEDARQQPQHSRALIFSVEYASARVRSAPPVAVATGDVQEPPPFVRQTIFTTGA